MIAGQAGAKSGIFVKINFPLQSVTNGNITPNLKKKKKMPSKHCTCQQFAALHCNTGLLHETQEVKLPAINCPGCQIKGSSAVQSCGFAARQLYNGLLVPQSRKSAPAVLPVTRCGSRGSFAY